MRAGNRSDIAGGSGDVAGQSGAVSETGSRPGWTLTDGGKH